MKKFSKRLVSAVLALITVLTAFASTSTTAFAANYSTNYSSYSAPSSSDYAYWNGSKMVKASGTTTSEIKWMQAALNYCIAKKGLNASKLDVDGSFGPASKKTTTAFQKKFGLSQDGSFGSKTISKMKSVLNITASTSTPSNITVSNIKKQITDTYASAKKASGLSNFSGKCGTYVKYQLNALGIISISKDTDCSGNGNTFYKNVKSGTTSKGYTKTKLSGGANCLANIVSKYGNTVSNIVISYPHQYGYTNSNPGYGHVVFIHAVINGTVYYSDNYTVGGVAEGGVLTKSVSAFDKAYTNSYGNAIGAIYFHK